MNRGKCRICDWNWRKIAGIILVLAIVLPLLVLETVPIAAGGAASHIEGQELASIVDCENSGDPFSEIPIESVAVNWGGVQHNFFTKISSKVNHKRILILS
jgi:hypothetical protein